MANALRCPHNLKTRDLVCDTLICQTAHFEGRNRARIDLQQRSIPPWHFSGYQGQRRPSPGGRCAIKSALPILYLMVPPPRGCLSRMTNPIARRRVSPSLARVMPDE